MSIVDNYPFASGSLTDIANAYKLFEQLPQYQAVLGWIGRDQRGIERTRW